MAVQQLAALLHLHQWKGELSVIEFAPGLRLCRTSGSTVERLYLEACSHEGVDSGEPYAFEAHFEVDGKEGGHAPSFIEHYDVLHRALNVLVMHTCSAVSFCRILVCTNSFHTYVRTAELFTATQVNEFYGSGALVDAGQELSLRACWHSVQRIWEARERSAPSLALSYFHFAWRAEYVEHMCINLAVVLEALFSPRAAGETAHQVAVNAARFLEPVIPDVERSYTAVKRFYAARSAIVHGSLSGEDKALEVAGEAFELVGCILRRLFSIPDLLAQFSDERLRRERLLSLSLGRK